MNEYGWFPVKVYIQKEAASQIWLTEHSSMVVRGGMVSSLSVSIFSMDIVSPEKKKKLLISCLRVFESYVDISLLSSKNLDSLIVFLMGKPLTSKSLVTRILTWLLHPGPSQELLTWRSYALQHSANILVTHQYVSLWHLGFSFLNFPYWGISSTCLYFSKIGWHIFPIVTPSSIFHFFLGLHFSVLSLSFW